jgi:shikimate kinase
LLETENPRRAFAQMLQARRPVYAKIADVRIDTSTLTDEEVAEKIQTAGVTDPGYNGGMTKSE